MLIKQPTHHFPHNILMALWNLPNFTISENSARNLWDMYTNCNAFHKAQVRIEQTCDTLKGLSVVDTANLNLLWETSQIPSLEKGYSYGKASKLEWKI